MNATSDQVWYVCSERCRRKAKPMAFSCKPAQVTGNRACVVCRRRLSGQWAIEVRPPTETPMREVQFLARETRRGVKCESPLLF